MVIFFFKQKTAYEMRISDWSSDVCSSDLAWALPAGSLRSLKAKNRKVAPLPRSARQRTPPKRLSTQPRPQAERGLCATLSPIAAVLRSDCGRPQSSRGFGMEIPSMQAAWEKIGRAHG